MKDSRGVRAPKRLGLALWATEPVPELVRHVQLAEKIGFDSVWVIDSQLLCRELFVTLAALAAGTSRIRVATGVTQPRTRHPTVTASALATLQEMSGGRIMAGMGTGFSSLRTLGMPAAKMSEFQEFVTTVRALLQDETITFEKGVQGKITWLNGPAGIPIFAACSGPKMTQLAAGIADGVILLQGIAPDLVERAASWLADGARAAGRAMETLEVACWIPLGMDKESGKAREQVRVRVAGAIMQVNPDWFEGAEREAVIHVQKNYQDFKHAEASADHAGIIPDRLVDRYAIAGRPDEVRERLVEVMARPELDHIILTPQATGSGSMHLGDLLRDLDRNVLARL